MSQLLAPLPSVEAYVAHFSQQALPVLRRTVRELDALRADPERAGSRQIATIVLSDPLMTMRMLTHIETHRGQSQNHDITTIERAVMMIGLEPFFRIFDDLPTVEDALKEHPRALVGVLRIIARARRVAELAREFAVTGLRLLVASGGEARILSAGSWGKLKTVWQMVAIIATFVLLAVREDFMPIAAAHGWLRLSEAILRQYDAAFVITSWVLSTLVVAVTLVSGWKYFADHWDLVTAEM